MAAADHDAAVSLFEHLKRAKQMLDADLISAADYDRIILQYIHGM